MNNTPIAILGYVNVIYLNPNKIPYLVKKQMIKTEVILPEIFNVFKIDSRNL